MAYGFKKRDGRQALYSISLDGSMSEALVFSVLTSTLIT